VRADENVLAAALAAGLPLPHSCRAGRCASCKAKLLAGDIAYPGGRLPPGILAAEAARGEVLLCQARPRADLVVETRRLVAPAAARYEAHILSVAPLPFGALHVRVRIPAGSIGVRPGQFVDAGNDSGAEVRVAVVAVQANELALEVAAADGALREWLDSAAAMHAPLRLSGPFDRPR
jgi:CDP-4-dehydro-6-deoxyglucose reductase, E3